MHKKLRKPKNNHPPFRLRLHKIPSSKPHPFRLRSKNYLGLYTCCGIFGLTLLAMLFPLDVNFAKAEDSASAATEVALTVGSSLAISLEASTPLEVVPSANGEFGTGKSNVTVTTSAAAGYGVFVNTPTSTTGSNRLVNTADSTKYVSPISGTGSVTSSTMAKNTWGYTLQKGTKTAVDVNAASTQFKAVPLTQGADAILSGDANASGAKRTDNYTLGFGAKIDNTVGTGTYTANVTVSVIAKPEKITRLDQLTYMQEMTTEICKGTPSPTGIGTTAALSATHIEKQLIDERDGKAYFVTKMADGNCWMTQNLALDINGTKTYLGGFKGISSGSGVPVANTTGGAVKLWSGNTSSSDRTGNLPKTTESTTEAAGSAEYYYDTQSWNLGSYALTSPSTTSDCGGVTSLSDCSSTTATNVGGYSQAPYKVYGSGQGYKYTGSGSTISGNYYDAHYLVGNYYQYNAAMAGSAGSTISSGTPAWSICPAGADSGTNWRPAVGTGGLGSTTAETFGNLLTKYGVTVDGSASSANIQKLPLTFSRIGYVYGSYLYGVGGGGYYWSRTINSSRVAYFLIFSSSTVYPAGNNISSYYRSLGFSLRCLYPST